MLCNISAIIWEIPVCTLVFIFKNLNGLVYLFQYKFFMSLVHVHDCFDCLPDGSFIPLLLSNCFTISIVYPMHLPTHNTAFSVTFDPSSISEFLASLFRCSRWRSQDIFFPCLPCILIILFHFSCTPDLGERMNVYRESKVNASIT